ncbi:MAG: hypothetical protein H8E44_13195 [Planctomycetes bacterium]|nr:hypothetical protein [Planctomycetota bacterium]
MSYRLKFVLSCACFAFLPLSLAGCGGDDSGPEGAPVVEERPADAPTPGSAKEGKLPAEFRQ